MSPRYLLDTDTVSDVIRHPQGVVATRIGEEGEPSICTSIVVAAELRFGAAKHSSERLNTQLEAILSALQILPLEEPADRRYGELRRELEHRAERQAHRSSRSLCRAGGRHWQPQEVLTSARAEGGELARLNLRRLARREGSFLSFAKSRSASSS